MSGSGYSAAMAFSVDSGKGLQAGVLSDAGGASAIFNTSGQLTQAALSMGTQVFELQSGTHADFGTDGILAWGRWIGTVAVPLGVSPVTTYSSNQGMHYVVGAPTPSMPTVGTATYTLLGATSPTYMVDKGVAPGVLTGQLSVSFGGAAPVVGMNLRIAMPDSTIYGVGGTAAISGSMFSGFQDLAGSGTVTVSGCSSGCNALVNGFFSGATAERAGLAYHINDPFASKDVVGTAAFTKQ